ncbi:MAG: gas vesicle structural protein GvpA [Actinocatenispora sp.]
MTVTTHGSGGDRAPNPSGLYDVLELILDKGLVIDAYVRVSLVGIELLTIDARIVIASVDTYLRFAEAVNRLDLTANKDSQTLPEMIGDLQETGAKGKTRGALSGAAETFSDAFKSGSDDDDEDEEKSKSRPRKKAAARRSRSRSGDDG